MDVCMYRCMLYDCMCIRILCITITTNNVFLELKPTEVYLSRLFIEGYAIKWRDIGLELNLTSAELDNIHVDHPNEVKERCRTMLKVWLQRDPEASWGKLLNAIQNADIHHHSGSVKTSMIFICISVLNICRFMYVTLLMRCQPRPIYCYC